MSRILDRPLSRVGGEGDGWDIRCVRGVLGQ